MPARDRLIVALDLPDLDAAREVARELGDAVLCYKVGPHLFVEGLFGFIEELVAGGKRVFLDFKSVDIGETMRAMAARAAQLGVELMTVMGGASTVSAAAAGRQGAATPKILLVTVLTDQDDADVGREYGAGKTVSQLVIDRARMAAEAGADGVVCSPHEAAAVRQAVARPGFLIVTPGIRPQGSAGDDQKRIATPARAIAAGADYLVIGRPIVRAADRRAAARKILAEIDGALAAAAG